MRSVQAAVHMHCLAARHIACAWLQSQQKERQGHVPSGLGWEPLDLTSGSMDFTQLLKGCAGVDQSVLGVDHQRGGSLAAYKRWASWSQEGLNLYAGETATACICF